MPLLSDETKLTLAGYVPVRNGYEIPGTDEGPLFEHVCWCWALSGGRYPVTHPRGAPSILDDLITLNFNDGQNIFATGVNPAPGQNYPGSAGDIAIMNNQLGSARTPRAGPTTPFTGSQTAFFEALVRVIFASQRVRSYGRRRGSLLRRGKEFRLVEHRPLGHWHATPSE